MPIAFDVLGGVIDLPTPLAPGDYAIDGATFAVTGMIVMLALALKQRGGALDPRVDARVSRARELPTCTHACALLDALQ